MLRKFIILPFLLITIFCLAQNPQGRVELILNNNGKRIVFNNVENEPNSDSVYYSINRDFRLKLSYAWYPDTGTEELYTPPPPYTYACYGIARSGVRDSTVFIWSFKSAYRIKLEIEDVLSKEKMIIIGIPARGEGSFILDITFQEGTFESRSGYCTSQTFERIYP